MKNQCLQDEGVDCSSHRMRAFVWDFEGCLHSQWSSPEFSRELRGEHRELYGNLQNPTQMLSYNWLNFISFQGWSPKGAWR